MGFFSKLAQHKPGSLVKELEEESAYQKSQRRGERSGWLDEVRSHMFSPTPGTFSRDEDDDVEAEEETTPIARSTVMASDVKTLREHYFDDTPGALAAYLFKDDDGHHIIFRRRSSWDEISYNTRDKHWKNKIDELVRDGYSIYEANWDKSQEESEDYDYDGSPVNEFIVDHIKASFYHTYGPAKED